jgi:hypothetical protein
MARIHASIGAHVTSGQRTGWCNRIGNALRALADRIDSRHTLALSIHTSPTLPAQQVRACIDQAPAFIHAHLLDLARAECIEDIMRKHCARLYG